MILQEIEPRKTYYQLRYDKKNAAGTRYSFALLKYFVLEIKENKVFASCNGAPPSWYRGNYYKSWMKEKPDMDQPYEVLLNLAKTDHRQPTNILK